MEWQWEELEGIALTVGDFSVIPAVGEKGSPALPSLKKSHTPS